MIARRRHKEYWRYWPDVLFAAAFASYLVYRARLVLATPFVMPVDELFWYPAVAAVWMLARIVTHAMPYIDPRLREELAVTPLRVDDFLYERLKPAVIAASLPLLIAPLIYIPVGFMMNRIPTPFFLSPGNANILVFGGSPLGFLWHPLIYIGVVAFDAFLAVFFASVIIRHACERGQRVFLPLGPFLRRGLLLVLLHFLVLALSLFCVMAIVIPFFLIDLKHRTRRAFYQTCESYLRPAE